MGETKHTRGPWVVGETQTVIDEVTLVESVGGFGVAGAVGGLDDGEQQANARLIAAAPELLTALSALIVVADRYDFRHRRSDGGYSSLGDTPAVAAARAAIAKATGAA